MAKLKVGMRVRLTRDLTDSTYKVPRVYMPSGSTGTVVALPKNADEMIGVQFDGDIRGDHGDGITWIVAPCFLEEAA